MSPTVSGQFKQSVNLEKFPFDTQKFSIDLAGLGSSPTDVKMVPGELYIAPQLSITDWSISEWEIKADRFHYSPEKVGPPLVSTSFVAKRNIGYYILKIVMPLSLIVMMSWSIFWIHPENAGTQIALSITGVLTLMTYRNMVDNLMPKLSYMTKMDTFILGSTILLFVSLLQAVTTSVLVSESKVHLAERIDVICRWLFPLIFVLLSMHFFLM